MKLELQRFDKIKYKDRKSKIIKSYGEGNVCFIYKGRIIAQLSRERRKKN